MEAGSRAAAGVGGRERWGRLEASLLRPIFTAKLHRPGMGPKTGDASGTAGGKMPQARDLRAL